jgi:hypothetical protein
VTGWVSFEPPPSVSVASVQWTAGLDGQSWACVGRHAPGSRRGTIEKRKPSRIVI